MSHAHSAQVERLEVFDMGCRAVDDTSRGPLRLSATIRRLTPQQSFCEKMYCTILSRAMRDFGKNTACTGASGYIGIVNGRSSLCAMRAMNLQCQPRMGPT
jgi:hypothetical protein